jgi:maltose O-acetyltransferase
VEGEDFPRFNFPPTSNSKLPTAARVAKNHTVKSSHLKSDTLLTMTPPPPPMQANEERRKMLAGELYQPFEPELTKERIQVKQLCFELNQTPPMDAKRRAALTKQILRVNDALVESPFNVDYGYNLTVGKNFYANHGCTILDCNLVKIGDNCLLGPHVCISAATHPLQAQLRINGDELAFPITIGNNVWISANVTICPGVTLGDNVVVGAGAVVNKSFPSNVVIAGVPAKIIGHIDNADEDVSHEKSDEG